MTQEQEEVQLEDRQVLAELALNEKEVVHPELGKVILRMPTLQIQRKIDDYQRVKKKELKLSTDKIKGEDGTTLTVPSYKSRDILLQEAKALGWWNDDQEEKLKELNNESLRIMTELELLGFVDDQVILEEMAECRTKLLTMFKDTLTAEISSAITLITTIGTEDFTSNEAILVDNAPSTDIDDIMQTIILQRRMYDLYVNLAEISVENSKLQSEYLSLVSDSWQERLQYCTRLAQIFYCTESFETHKPLWEKIEDLEEEENTEYIRWLLSELTAFWHGWTEESRDRMEKYSFTYRRNSEKQQSTEDSPVPSMSSSDGESPESEQTSSSEASDTSDPSLPSKSTSATM